MIEKENIIQKKTFDFALSIIKLYVLLTEKKEYGLSKQLLRCGTSVGANVEEAIGGFSRKDFIAKMGIAYKEARETRYWLRLYQESKMAEVNFEEHLKCIEEIINILKSIIKTSLGNEKG